MNHFGQEILPCPLHCSVLCVIRRYHRVLSVSSAICCRILCPCHDGFLQGKPNFKAKSLKSFSVMVLAGLSGLSYQPGLLLTHVPLIIYPNSLSTALASCSLPCTLQNLTPYKALHNLAPHYLSDLLHLYTPLRSLRSASAVFVIIFCRLIVCSKLQDEFLW